LGEVKALAEKGPFGDKVTRRRANGALARPIGLGPRQTKGKGARGQETIRRAPGNAMG
jgi:hypothetical protein